MNKYFNILGITNISTKAKLLLTEDVEEATIIMSDILEKMNENEKNEYIQQIRKDLGVANE